MPVLMPGCRVNEAMLNVRYFFLMFASDEFQ